MEAIAIHFNDLPWFTYDSYIKRLLLGDFPLRKLQASWAFQRTVTHLPLILAGPGATFWTSFFPRLSGPGLGVIPTMSFCWWGSHFWGKHTWKHWTSNVHSAYIVVTSIYDRMSLLQQMKQWPGVGVCFFSFCFCLEIQREGYAAGFLPEACPQEWCSQQSSHKVFLDVFSCFSTLVHKPQVLP